MPMAAITAYLNELPGLMAEWRINMMEAVIMPYLKQGDRKRAVRSTQVLAYGEEGPRRIAAPPRLLGLIGIGVHVVKG